MLFIMQLFVVVIAFLLLHFVIITIVIFLLCSVFLVVIAVFIVTVCCYHCDNYLFFCEIEHELNFSDPQLWVIQIYPGEISAL